MEELPATLDDGELWLPSDIFPPDDHSLHHSPPFTSNHSSMEDLSRQFSHLGFLDRPPIPVSFPEQLEVFGQMAQYTTTSPSPNGRYGLTVGPAVDQGLFNFAQPGPRFPTPDHPAFRCSMVQPVQPQVFGQLMETRKGSSSSSSSSSSSGPVHGQQNRPLNTPFVFHPNGFRSGSSLRDYRGSTSGTGVFIPRTTTTPNCRRKQSGVKSQRMPSKNHGLGSAGEYCHHRKITSSDVVLPKDWTY